MQTIRKFIINRDNIKYIYIEHLTGNFNYNAYHVYRNSSDYESLSPNNFYLIYGNDKKLTVKEYINEAEVAIIGYSDNNNSDRFFLKEFSSFKNYLKFTNEYNPSLKGYKATLLSSIDYYNDILLDKIPTIDYDYERDIKRLNGEDIEDITRNLVA